MTDQLNAVAYGVQTHVSEQPWGAHGHQPEPLQIRYSGLNAVGHLSENPWSVSFVVSLNRTGSKRVWQTVNGATLEDALREARVIQANTPQPDVQPKRQRGVR